MRLRFIPQTMVALAGCALTACASGPSATRDLAPAPGFAETAPGFGTRSSRSVLTGDEIRAQRLSSTLDAVERLRPEFLRARGVSLASPLTARQPGVFHNGVYLGGLETLRSFSPLEVVAIRRLTASDVTLRYGSRFGGMDGLEVVTSATGHARGR